MVRSVEHSVNTETPTENSKFRLKPRFPSALLRYGQNPAKMLFCWCRPRVAAHSMTHTRENRPRRSHRLSRRIIKAISGGASSCCVCGVLYEHCDLHRKLKISSKTKVSFNFTAFWAKSNENDVSLVSTASCRALIPATIGPGARAGLVDIL